MWHWFGKIGLCVRERCIFWLSTETVKLSWPCCSDGASLKLWCKGLRQWFQLFVIVYAVDSSTWHVSSCLFSWRSACLTSGILMSPSWSHHVAVCHISLTYKLQFSRPYIQNTLSGDFTTFFIKLFMFCCQKSRLSDILNPHFSALQTWHCLQDPFLTCLIGWLFN